MKKEPNALYDKTFISPVPPSTVDHLVEYILAVVARHKLCHNKISDTVK